MLFCSDCDKDVEFKSLDVGGMLTHCCIECGSTNLFRSKEVYEAGVEFVVETAKKIEDEKIRKAKERKESETSIILESFVFVLIPIIILAIIFVIISKSN